MFSEQREFETPPTAGRFSLLLLGVIVTSLAIAFVVSRQFGARGEGMGSKHPAVGQALKHLALEPLTGTDQPLALHDLSGKVTLINIWGTWCGPCLIEFPHLRDLEEHFRSEPDFLFVSVSCGAGGNDARLALDTAALLKEMQADFATYADPQEETRGEIARLAGVGQVPYPTSVIVGRDGKVWALWFGYVEGLTTEMREVIDDALREKPG